MVVVSPMGQRWCVYATQRIVGLPRNAPSRNERFWHAPLSGIQHSRPISQTSQSRHESTSTTAHGSNESPMTQGPRLDGWEPELRFL